MNNKRKKGKNEWSELAVLLNNKNSEVRITRVTVEYVNFGTEYGEVKERKGKKEKGGGRNAL